jgi:hypothetical protein
VRPIRQASRKITSTACTLASADTGTVLETPPLRNGCTAATNCGMVGVLEGERGRHLLLAWPAFWAHPAITSTTRSINERTDRSGASPGSLAK